MFRLASVIASFSLLVFIAGCQTSSKPATVEGECSIFHDPKFPVKGAREKDQRWITRTQETGISVCGWARPAPEPEVPTVADVPKDAPPAPPPSASERTWRRWLGV